MGFNTHIEWCKMTWNPVQGCHKISEGCKNCYMFRDKKRYGQDGNNVHRSTDATFFKPLVWHKQIKPETPKHERLVFTASWSDWFIEENDKFRDEMWQVVRDTPNLIYQILTKRADRINNCLPSDWGNGYDNVWLGVSVENQQRADERIPLLLDTPATYRFLSVEPLLERVDLWRSVACYYELKNVDWVHAPGFLEFVELLDGVIIGGESGAGARPFHLEWGIDLIRECKEAGVKVFFKQAGSNPYFNGKPLKLKSRKGNDLQELPEEMRVREI